MKPMNVPDKIFKSYDIRGVYPTEISEENIATIIASIYAYLTKDKKPQSIVLGYDMRISSPALSAIAKETLVKLGAHVIDVGLLATPTFYFAVYHGGYDAGIQITASHNPKEYNGIKIVKKGERGLVKIGKTTGMDEIKQMAMSGMKIVATQGGSIEEKKGVVDEEVENSLRFVKDTSFKQFSIVADPANAMGITYLEALFNKVPVNLIKMNFVLDGTFPSHQPDPLDFNNLVGLQKKVVEAHADFGLAPDGDGDRLFFIDEKGQVIPGTLITALIAKELLKKYPGETILFDIRNILTPRAIVEENGGKYEITKVGHAYITEALERSGALFAGEGSAHYFFRDSGNAESQVPIILIVMEVLTREKKPLSEIISQLRRSHESGEINFTVSNASKIMSTLKESFKDGRLDELDGIAISYPDWRFSVRSSNTEPLLRLNVEALSKETMEEKKSELVDIIKSFQKT